MTTASPRRAHIVRLALIALGWLLIVATPFVAVIPGPGGVFVFAAGLALILKNSAWAKGRYAAAARRWPRFARWANAALRRRSPRHHAETAALKAELATRNRAWRARWRRRLGRAG